MTYLTKMKRRFFSLTSVFVAAAIAVAPATVFAQDEAKKTKKEYPLVTINVANLDRLTKDVDYMFRTAGRSDVMEMITKQLGEFNDLNGVERNKSFGLIIYLELAIPPKVSPIGYIPITNKNEFLKTLKSTGFLIDVVKDLPDTYEIKRGKATNGATIYFSDGYCFIGKDADDLDREFPDPESWAKGLAAKYDVAASLNLKSIPEAVKKTFVLFLRQYSNAQMQQRNNEQDGAYQFRRNQSASQMEFFEGLLNYGESFMIGLDASEDKKSVTLELEILAKKNSPFAKELSEFTGKKSYFSSLVDDNAPLSASMSVKLNKTNQKQYISTIVFAKEQILKQLTRQNLGDGQTPLESDKRMLSRIGDPLLHTIEKGFLDIFLQLDGNPQDRMSLIGGAKIEEGRTLARGLPEFLNKIQELNQNGPVIELNHFTHRNVTFHKISGRSQQGQPAREGMFGKSPAFYVGVGANTIWFTFGGDHALNSLKSSMDKVADRSRIGQKTNTRAPVHAVANISRWLSIAPTGEKGPGKGRLQAEKAFVPGKDRISFEVRPLDNGVRMRVKFEEGMVQFVGIALAEAIQNIMLKPKEAPPKPDVDQAKKKKNDGK